MWLQVEVCCFDKTGTLTSDRLLLEDVVVSDKQAPAAPASAAADGEEPPATSTSTTTSKYNSQAEVDPQVAQLRAVAHRVMATCHSLVTLTVPGGEPEIVGDPLEKAALEVRT